MAILVANIGTSDISVKMGDYYLPIGFERDEPNLLIEKLSEAEKTLWKDQRSTLIQTFAQETLGLEAGSKFRAITQQLALQYREAPNEWHSQIRIGRLWGVVQAAIQAADKAKLPLQTIFLFVTDQQPEHPQDTVYALEIVLQWLAIEAPNRFAGDSPQIKLQPQLIRPEVPANDEDELIGEYYNFFQTFDRDQVAYISIKGGTGQMQAALKTQAISANLKAQVILKPDLSVAEIFKGEASKCRRVAYWRYQQAQRYDGIRQLLSRWDFDGAVVLLNGWRETLQSLIDSQVTDDKHELQNKRDTVVKAIVGLEVAIDCLSLDQESAQKRLKHRRLSKAIDLPFKSTLENYGLLENLYAQGKIYQDSRQVPNFLARMGSFYEVSQKCLLEKLGNSYLETDGAGRLLLLAAEVSQTNQPLWKKFLEVHHSVLLSKAGKIESLNKAIDGTSIDLEHWC
ncbi:MAG: hypothetical protein HC895_13895 [Leptolyngbyaceae cyanobacterium SM1_3_5]|nr:hypothetical protein [Leptolyngbyaceae cyanobacterium SM1_3_5]